MDKEIKIIYESPEFVVIDKPAGMTVHRIKAAKKEREGEDYLTDRLLDIYPELSKVGDDPEWRPGIVHRLDKNTSGIMVVPRSQPYFEYLKNLFQTGGMRKTYLALVHGEINNDTGVIEKPIGIKSGTTKRTVHGGKMMKPAITEYKVLKRFEGYTLVEASPRTGRTHQIRVHLASNGHPIVGDTLYGGKKEKKLASCLSGSLLKVGRQFLHAHSLEFDAAPGHRVSFTADLPEDLSGLLDRLTKGRNFI